MQLTSSPRRALGLVAVGAIGMSTAVLGVTGTAAAATTSWTFTTASSGADETGVTSIEIETDPSGECSIAWLIDGAAGGAGTSTGGPATGSFGGRIAATSEAYDGDVYDLYPGGKGGDAASAGGTGGTNGYGYPYEGDDGVVGPGFTSGGGGGASAVESDGGVFLGAFGGDGGYALNGNGRGGPEGTSYVDHADDVVTGTSAVTGNGVISGKVTCVTGDAVAPGAPTLADHVTVGDGTATFEFTPGTYGRDTSESEVESTFEYQLDGGTWTGFAHGYTAWATSTGTLTGLENLTTYELKVRATGTAGTSEASAPVTFTPYRPTAAPTGVTAKVGAGSVVISWTVPADADGIVDYLAFAVPDGAQSSQDLVVCTTTGTSCAVPAKAGTAYTYGVTSRDALGNEGDRAFGDAATAVVPASAIASTLPRSDGPLTSSESDGTAVAGSEITISGAGFLPGSTVELVVYSTPVKLGEAVVLADGTFSATVTLPEDLTNGDHHLVATGVDPDGNVRNLVVEVTVSGGAAVLADTGFSAAPVLGAGALALLAGGGLMFAARRRQAA